MRKDRIILKVKTICSFAKRFLLTPEGLSPQMQSILRTLYAQAQADLDRLGAVEN